VGSCVTAERAWHAARAEQQKKAAVASTHHQHQPTTSPPPSQTTPPPTHTHTHHHNHTQWAGGYVASCVSRGRLALVSDNKTKVRLAKEAQEAARTALRLDPHDDLAHHLMGRWHYEMAQLNFVVRQLIKLVYGAALAPGTFAEAADSFRAAAELNPGKLIHRVELGRTYLKLGRRAEAVRELEASLGLELDDVNAVLEREEAELMLAKLQREFERSVVPLAWAGAGKGAGGGGGGEEGKQ